MAHSRAVLPPKVDDLEVCIVPGVLREQSLQIRLGLLHTAAIGEAPPVAMQHGKIFSIICNAPLIPLQHVAPPGLAVCLLVTHMQHIYM